MSFLEKIIERENVFLTKVRQVQRKLPLYIWGAGEGARNIELLLKKEGIPFDGVMVNRKFMHNCAHGGGGMFRRLVGESGQDKHHCCLSWV